MRKLKQGFIITLVATLLIMFDGIPIFANDFATNRQYYENLCFSTTAKENAATCRAFQDFINQEAKNAEDELKQLREDIKDLRSDILKYSRLVTQYNQEIEETERQITVLTRSINQMEASILKLIDEIATLEENVKVRDQGIQSRMVSLQGFYSVNGFIDIIMGASTFTDLIRRIEGINDITYYDKEQIQLLMAEITQIEDNKIELERQRNALSDNKVNLEIKQTTVEGLKKVAQEIVVEFRKQESELMDQENELVADLKAVQDQIRRISDALNAIEPSPGWIRPIPANFRITAGVWYYPSGGIHLGVDFAARVGTNIVAVANGVIIYSLNACPTYGFLGNRCGFPGSSGGGNQVYLIASVNNRTYAIRYLHLEAGSPIARGTIVRQGDVIGRVGSSGNSSGPHLHIEVVYLGTNTVNHYATNWNGDLSFGTGWGTTGMATRCSVRNNAPPCRLNPSEIFGVQVFRNY